MSDFSRLHNLGKLSAFTVIKEFFLFFDWLYLSAKEKVSKIRIIFVVCRLPFAVNVMLNLSIVRCRVTSK